MATRTPPLSADHAVGSVREIRALSSRFTRVVLDVPDLDELDLPRNGDTAVGVYFGDGPSSPGRTYTLRVHDPDGARIAVDVYLHGDGIGTAWATHARMGSKVILAHANSWYRPPQATDWQLLAADMAGLPALARILEEPPRFPTTVVVEVTDRSDLDYLPDRPDVRVTTVSATDDADALSGLAQHVAASLGPDGTGYCWFAGEAGEARAVRKHLRHHLRWELDQLDVMGYWRHHSADWDERFAGVGADLYSVYTTALADGKSEKSAMEEFDEALEQAGL